MPWCADCDRFLNPNTLRADGTCPTCQRPVAEPGPATASTSGAMPSADAVVDVKAPWHFKLLVVATVLYLVWRVVQMAGWVVG